MRPASARGIGGRWRREHRAASGQQADRPGPHLDAQRKWPDPLAVGEGRRWHRPHMAVLDQDARAAQHGAGPVSYTHLRAHETRHDLVCRLLLEKKKKKNKKTNI